MCAFQHSQCDSIKTATSVGAVTEQYSLSLSKFTASFKKKNLTVNLSERIMGSVKETRKNKKRLSRVLINSIQHYAIGARIPAAAKIPFLIKYAVKNRRKLSRFKSVSLHFSICCTAAGLACTSEGFTLKIFLQSCQVEVSDFIICLSKMECNRKPQNDRNDKSL